MNFIVSDLVVERAWVEVKELCGLFLVAFGSSKRILDQLLLKIAHFLIKVHLESDIRRGAALIPEK